MTSNGSGTLDRLTVGDKTYLIHRLDRVGVAERLTYSPQVLPGNGIMQYLLRELL